ncbi:hypothetical protein G0P98_28525, partial [Yangia sp. PrR004]|nr:hypothetical protein [Salipiger sp. PrR004]
AALAMALGVLLMVFLWLRLSKLVEGLKRLNYAASKLFVHLCAILLVSLASEILVLISVKCQLYVVGAPPLALLVVLCYL